MTLSGPRRHSPICKPSAITFRDYIKQFNPYAAAKVAAEILATGDGLLNFPQRGRIVPNTNLREAITSHPYIIRYRIDGSKVIILRVRHTARLP